jgi:hypothetical protein
MSPNGPEQACQILTSSLSVRMRDLFTSSLPTGRFCSITFDRRMNRQQQQAHGVVVTKLFRSRNELAVAEIS